MGDISVTAPRGILEEMWNGMRGIDAASQKIARATRTIHEIAFQTSVLALNAAMHPARSGMSLAVVADKVRKQA
jgi:methyl-accepting chemotaxis protein